MSGGKYDVGGYSTTATQDLEKHLGSRSTLYHTFGGKRQLSDRTLAIHQDKNLGRLRRTLHDAPDLRKSLNDLLMGAVRAKHHGCPTGSRGCYVVNATTEMANLYTDVLSFVAQNRERFVAIMAGALARAQVRGKLDEQRGAGELADYLFVCYNGLQVVVQTKIEQEQLVKAVERAVKGLPWRR